MLYVFTFTYKSIQNRFKDIRPYKSGVHLMLLSLRVGQLVIYKIIHKLKQIYRHLFHHYAKFVQKKYVFSIYIFIHINQNNDKIIRNIHFSITI